MNFLKNYRLLGAAFIFVSLFLPSFHGDGAFAQGSCYVVESVGICGGETNTNTVPPAPCTCQPGWRCTSGAYVSYDCVCELDLGDCPIPYSVTTCGDSGTVGNCGVAGGCGYSTLRCVEHAGPGTSIGSVTYTYECVSSDPGYEECTCSSNATCLGTCVNGSCELPSYTSIDSHLSTGEPYDGPIIWNIEQLLSPIFKIIFYAGIFIGILGIIYSGYLLVASEGDPGRVKEGKDQFTAAVLGTLFVLLSVFILRAIIDSILGGNSGL